MRHLPQLVREKFSFSFSFTGNKKELFRQNLPNVNTLLMTKNNIVCLYAGLGATFSLTVQLNILYDLIYRYLQITRTKEMITKDKNVQIFNQILLTNNIRNIWRIVRRIWMLILGLEGFFFLSLRVNLGQVIKN